MREIIITIALLLSIQLGAAVIISTFPTPTVTVGSKEKGIPVYERGKGKYQWVLSRSELMNGIGHLGAHERLRVALNKLRQGKRLHITTIGGSITSGQDCVDAPSWPGYLVNYMQDEYGADKVELHNGAVSGTISAFMSACHNMHVPKVTDIVFVEYSVNDPPDRPYLTAVRRSFERLLRKLLTYPNKPAVILVHSYIWYHARPHKGSFWSNTEREFSEFSLFYHLPSLSVKASCYAKMVAKEEGFDVTVQRLSNRIDLANKAFYWNEIHPDGRTGARVTGELAMNLLRMVYNELETLPITDDDTTVVMAPLPSPMIPNNFESVSDKCFIGSHFTATVKEKKGWEWINEARKDQLRPKWGFVANETGATLKIEIDTRAAAAVNDHQVDRVPFADSALVLVQLAYLRSYNNMGRGVVSCLGGCYCNSSWFEGHQSEKNSQLFLHDFYVSQYEKCIVSIVVGNETNSGKHKVKLSGIMISEEPGLREGIKNSGAVDFVADISSRGRDGTFSTQNVV